MNLQPIFGRNSNLFNYSTVTERVKKEVSYESIMMTFTICIKTSTLTKTTHYTQGINKTFSMKSKDLKKMRGMDIRELVTFYMRKVIGL